MNRRMSRRLGWCSLVFVLILAGLVAIVTVIQAQDGESEHIITIFAGQDSLYIYIPAGIADGYTIELQQLCFETVDVEQRCLSDYPNFQLPLQTLSPPICFELVRDGASPIPPDECDRLPTERFHSQTVNDANVFWHDRQGRAFNVRLNAELLQTCPGNAVKCDVPVPLQPIAATSTIVAGQPTSTPTPRVSATAARAESDVPAISPSVTDPPTATATTLTITAQADLVPSNTPEQSPDVSPTPTPPPTVADNSKKAEDEEPEKSDLEKFADIAKAIGEIIGAVSAVVVALSALSARFRQSLMSFWKRFRGKRDSDPPKIKHEGLRQLAKSLNAVIAEEHHRKDGTTIKFRIEFVPTQPQAALEEIEQQVRLKADALGLPPLADLTLTLRPMVRNADRIRIEGYLIVNKD